MKTAPLDQLPTQPGAYRWIYADAACGDFTAVAIFMIGSVFSSRYVEGAARGIPPVAHSAVNFALYEKGARVAWVLSEYPGAHLWRIPGGRTVLRIGHSRLEWMPDGAVRLHVSEQTAERRSRRLHAHLALRPSVAPHPELDLGHGHRWHPLAVRAGARLRVRGRAALPHGHGYLDSNHGAEPLGVALPGWRWLRTHTDQLTRVMYELPGGEAWEVVATDESTQARRVPATTPPLRTTPWGLKVPRSFALPPDGAGATVHAPARLLESSPFYARLEARTEGVHALGEVAHFRRFRSPLVRWMADYRTRVEEAAP